MTPEAGAGNRYMIVGDAGFLGSHFTDRLLADADTAALTVYDNFSSGREWHIADHRSDSRCRVIRAETADQERLTEAMAGHGVVLHLAANPDIARAAVEPAIDFDEGTVLTHHVLEAMRRTDCRRILYASGSGVYGDLGETEVGEAFGPLRPISTYGASKLACEAMISAYVHLFGLNGCIFRFGNVVGPRQTHGVGLDFIAKLEADPRRLEILGDGRQSKHYIHVDDVVTAVLLANRASSEPLGTFNVATADALSVAEIADLAVDAMGLDPGSVEYVFGGGARGWKGDVPVVRLNAKRIEGLGWRCRFSSKEAVRRSLDSLVEEARLGRAASGGGR